MLNQYKPIIITLTVIALIVFSTVKYVQYLMNDPSELLDNITIPTEFEFQGAKIALAWTDDNTGETLIIQSDKKNYYGFSSAKVYFSITNISKQDQNMDVVVWVKNDKVRVEGMERLDTEDNGYNALALSAAAALSAGTGRKDIKGFTCGNQANDSIKSGQTNYYKATLKYPPMSKGEFFIEAFGRNEGSIVPAIAGLWSQGANTQEGDKIDGLQNGSTAARPAPVRRTGAGLRDYGAVAVSAYGHLDPWYSSNWLYKRAIILNHDKIATTTSAFPVLATTTLDDLRTTTHDGKVGNDYGYDIVFVDDDDSTVLNYEREYYASTTGEIAYWIKTDISSTTDKTIYMYYGSSASSDQATTTGVWDDNYVMVNHLAHDGVATTTYPDFNDSTKYNNDGSSKNMNSDDLVDGQIDGSLDFDGGDDYVNIPDKNSLDITSQLSLSFWINPEADQAIDPGQLGAYSYLFRKDTEYKIKLNDASGGTNNLSGYAVAYNIITDEWTHAVFTVDALGNSELFINSSSESTSVATLTANSNALITGQSNITGWYDFNGQLDEVRISNVARTAGWIETEYNNQVSVGDFMTFGAEETLKLDITTAAKVLTAGTESGAYTVQAQNSDGDAMVMGNNVTVNLASDSSGTYHFAATAAGAAVTTVTIPADSSSVNFYYTDHKMGAPTITVTATNYTQDTQQQMVQGVWYNTGYQCRRQITFDADQISTTTSAFPVLATSTLAEMATVANGGCVQNDDGRDIIFVDDDNTTLLNFEREYYDPATGEIAYWIKTDISSTTDKTIYMYYGSSASSDQATTTGVWDDNYVMVNHLAHDGVATTTYPDFNDSTKYNNDGSSKNMNSDDLVDGQIDGALDFGQTSHIVVANEPNFDITSAITITAWVKFTTAGGSGYYCPVFTKGSTSAYGGWFYDDTRRTRSYLQIDSVDHVYNGDIVCSLDNWCFVSYTYGDGYQRTYVNKILDLDREQTGNIDTNAVAPWIGSDAGLPQYMFPGLIDEVRISNVARTAGWIETEYNNQVSVGNFMTFGAEVCLSVPVERSGGESVKTRIKGGTTIKGGVRF